MRLLSPRQTRQWASTWLVTVSGWIVGHAAQHGMDRRQWAAAGFAIFGSVLLAALAHAKPQPADERG